MHGFVLALRGYRLGLPVFDPVHSVSERTVSVCPAQKEQGKDPSSLLIVFFFVFVIDFSRNAWSGPDLADGRALL